jgi:hypothetical protein
MPINSPTGFLDITNATLRTSNLEAENLLITGGNIYVTSELEADATVLNLENVTRKGNVSSNTIEITNATTGIVATGNVHALKFIGSGSHLTGIPPTAITGTLSQWSDGANSDVYIASNVGIGNVHTLTSNNLQVGGNLYVRDTDANVLTVNGNVVASYFEGDGSKLSGIVTDLQGVTDNGNVTTNVVQFSNATTGLVTTANIEVGGDIKVVGLSAGTVPYVASDKFLKDSFITMTGDATVITSNLDVTGNIFMRGEKFIIESETKLINDAIIGIANNNASSTTDKGIIMQNDPSNANGNVAIIHHGAGGGFADQLTFGYTADPLDTVTVTNDLTKELTVNVLGNVITQNNLSVGGTLSINNITAAAQHSLQAVTNVGNVTSNTVQFSNAITSLVASSNIVATGNVSAGRDTDTTSYFGRAAVGYMGTSDQASFAHFDRNSSAQYALKQTAVGATTINTPATQHIRFTVNDGNAGAEKMRITSAGNVGIGVSAPHANLHVEGNVYVSSNLTVGGNVAVDTDTLFVDSVNDRVGIGVTNPSHALNVKATSGDAEVHIQAQGNDGGDAILYFNGSSTNQRKCAIISSNVAPNAYCKQDLHFCMETTDDLSDVDITDSKMVLTNAGNVGIGTVSPSMKLSVDGHIQSINDAGSNDIMGLVSAHYGDFFHIGAWNADGSSSKNIVMNYLGGRVGVGITNPRPTFEVFNSGLGTGDRNDTGKIFAVQSDSTSWTSGHALAGINIKSAVGTGGRFLQCNTGFGSTGASTLDAQFILYEQGTGSAEIAWNGGGADYAEYFEWSDGNPDDEDRVGMTVKLNGDKIELVSETDDTNSIIGAISANPGFVGDNAGLKWKSKYLRDDFGRLLMEDYEVYAWKDEKGDDHIHDVKQPIPEDLNIPEDRIVKTARRRVLNPSFDPDVVYVPREERKEWSTVGLVGKLRIRTDQPIHPNWILLRNISDSVGEWLIK